MKLAIAVLLASVSLAQAQAQAQTQTTIQSTAGQPTASQPAQPAQNKTTQGGLGFGKHDASAPINVSADSFKGDMATKVGIYIGNVVIVQGDMTMRADQVRIEELDNKPNKITGTGNVVVTAPNGTGTGDVGVYDVPPRIITLTGKVVLTKEKNVMRGTYLTMDMNTNLAHLTAQGMPGGRVQALFIPPPQSEKSGSAAKKPAAGGGK
ncbi:MAG TPA: lipopolysaccharide transport periplasmic protein LptA [Rhizomicrobium sp.]|nr:lipopolysaccharide transport periplasmic protein LptA [Rhizomicrobium sp.]